MNNTFLSFLLLIVSLSACTHRQAMDTSMSFDSTPSIQAGHLKSFEAEGWFVPNGKAHVDSVVLYGNHKSVRLSNAPQDTTKIAQLYYFVNAEKIEGDSIRFSGKFRYKGADSTAISFGIQQIDKASGPLNTVTDMGKNSGESDWKEFTVTAAISPQAVGIFFFTFNVGDIELWLNDCKAEIDGRPLDSFLHKSYPATKDNEFDKGSNITLPPPTPQMIENLEVLGKVWGFMKYYHPGITQGNYNWDYELFRILPQIATASDKAERNKILNKWIDRYGKITEIKPYKIEDPGKYSRIIDLNWINDQNLFDNTLISKLNTIKEAKRSAKVNYYLISYLLGNSDTSQDGERSYPSITWEDQGFRILSLFRFWNAMEYCFPYVEMTDTPWKSVLKEFLPEFVSPLNKATYELALNKMVASIDDSHGRIQLSTAELGTTVLKRRSATYTVPATLTVSKSGDIVVKETNTLELERGDIIRSIDGEDVEKIINDLKPYVPASNKAVLYRNTLPWLLRSDTNVINITCIRNGKETALSLKNFGPDRRFESHESGQMKWPTDYKLDAKKIIYINVSSMNGEIISNAIKKNKEAKGMILDMRQYPNGEAFSTLYSLLFPSPQEFMWFSENEKAAPGNYPFTSTSTIGTNNPDYFKGKVAILVDEGTQSHGEFSSMAYRKAPRSVIIGSTTAGADGNVAFCYLPGNIRIVYTALGAYYPNWEICQRKGIQIDREVRPTNEEIRNGQDVWIEKAIEYILDK